MVRNMAEKAPGYWDFAVSVYGLCRRPHLRDLTRYIRRKWKPRERFEVSPRHDGFFLVRFASLEDRDDALKNRPCMLDNQLLVVQKWKADAPLTRFVLTDAPIWIRLPFFGYPWTRDSLARVASGVGKPYDYDRRALTDRCFQDALICVTVSADDVLPAKILVKIEGEKDVEIEVKYEAVPEKCDKCVAFGHSAAKCPFASSPSPGDAAEKSSTSGSSPRTAAAGGRGGTRSRRGRRKSTVEEPRPSTADGAAVKHAAAHGSEKQGITASRPIPGMASSPPLVQDLPAHCLAGVGGKDEGGSLAVAMKTTATASNGHPGSGALRGNRARRGDSTSLVPMDAPADLPPISRGAFNLELQNSPGLSLPDALTLGPGWISCSG